MEVVHWSDFKKIKKSFFTVFIYHCIIVSKELVDYC